MRLRRVGATSHDGAAVARRHVAAPPAERQALLLSSGMIRQEIVAFVNADADLAEKVLLMDNTVDRMNREVAGAMLKQMSERPEVTRPALDALLVARNLERVADHATNIAEDVIFWVRGADVRHGGASRLAAKPRS